MPVLCLTCIHVHSSALICITLFAFPCPTKAAHTHLNSPHFSQHSQEVAAELAAAAEKEGAGHGIRGPPTFLHNPSPYPRAPLNYHTTNTTQHTTSKHARLQSLGNRSLNATATTHRPRAHSNAHHNSASAPLPAAHAHAHTHAAARRVVPAIGAEYDGHEDSEDGTPQVPPPRFPAGQPHGVPRPPVRVLCVHLCVCVSVSACFVFMCLCVAVKACTSACR